MTPRRVLDLVFWTAVAVSIVHYVDNVTAHDAYPQPESGPAPSATAIAISWFVFTGFGLAGYVLFRRDRIDAASVCLAVYAVSGLIGLGHYTVEGATEMPWWRQAHIVADIVCGLAILAFVVWARGRSRAGFSRTAAR